MKLSEMYYVFRTNLEIFMLNVSEVIGIILYYLHVSYNTQILYGSEIILGYGKFKHSRFRFYIPVHYFPHIDITFFWQYQSIYKSFIYVGIEYTTPYEFEYINDKIVEKVQYAKEVFEFPKIIRSEFKNLDMQ